MIRRLLIEIDTRDGQLAPVHDDFPSLVIARAPRCGPDGPPSRPVVDAASWCARASLSRASFDGALEAAAAGGALSLGGDEPSTVGLAAWEILTAYQRHLGRRNGASRGLLFDDVLRVHAGLHATGPPAAIADRNQALDVWQWLLRLRPSASMAAQIAALFHHVERLVSEDEPLERDEDSLEQANARTRAAMIRAFLGPVGVDAGVVERACDLLERQDAGSARNDPTEEELRALMDADALSFFSVKSPGCLDSLGPSRGRKKIAWALQRLGPARRPLLRRVRLRRDVRALLDGMVLDGMVESIAAPVEAAP